MNLAEHLQSLGFTEKESKLYITLLEIGPNPVSSIARKAGITRTTAYAALETLKEKGLVSAIEQGGIQQYAGVEPEKLEEYAKNQQEKAEENYKKIKSIVPQLKSLTGDLVMAPKVKYYEGAEGIKTIYNDTIEVLKKLPKNERIKLSYSSASEVAPDLRRFLDEYVKTRKKHHIMIKGIFPETEESRKYQKKSKQHFAEVKIMPEDISLEFDTEISIYGNKISVMSLKPDRLHGAIIESPEIASSYRAVFEITWRACKKHIGL